MVLLKKGTIAAAFVVASMFAGQAAFAQDTEAPITKEQLEAVEFSDDELSKFIKANTAAVELEKQGREAVVTTIEGTGLTVDRFNELAQANRDKKLDEVAKDDEKKAFGDAVRGVLKLRPENKQKVEKAITDQGLTLEQYNKIHAAFQKDKAVQAKVQLLLQEK
ncbi:DUF4168 domain-containing protein [Pontibacter cellulosilyticus]|uniref:DUF4168 domain-containing protein n=1 Tax=Pontibacter cellulosilyticus TaxID=1720253 RepID=A0A923SMY3_9BACT|nr:DUF4168 domain-containing protein [Pontibacter cellulosilyticus]MBC5992635.1 DUF4168 domain-containing protein [Pontibacter cellulosilyticus]